MAAVGPMCLGKAVLPSNGLSVVVAHNGPLTTAVKHALMCKTVATHIPGLNTDKNDVHLRDRFVAASAVLASASPARLQRTCLAFNIFSDVDIA